MGTGGLRRCKDHVDRGGQCLVRAPPGRWPPADVAIERIGELLQYDLETLVRRKT
jgi:hypothetical protein